MGIHFNRCITITLFGMEPLSTIDCFNFKRGDINGGLAQLRWVNWQHFYPLIMFDESIWIHLQGNILHIISQCCHLSPYTSVTAVTYQHILLSLLPPITLYFCHFWHLSPHTSTSVTAATYHLILLSLLPPINTYSVTSDTSHHILVLLSLLPPITTYVCHYCHLSPHTSTSVTTATYHHILVLLSLLPPITTY